MTAPHPTFWLIAGPNGVGKTTFAMKRLEAISGSIKCVLLNRGLWMQRVVGGHASRVDARGAG